MNKPTETSTERYIQRMEPPLDSVLVGCPRETSEKKRHINPSILYISVLFFITGFCSLTYQIIWNKVLSQTIGTDFYSNTLIISIFMLGLGLGGHIGAIVTKKCKAPILYFLWAEILISLFGVFSISVIREIQNISAALSGGELGPVSLLVDFALNFILLLMPTFFMGVSLPIVTHEFRNRLNAGAVVGFLYAVNISGAACGAFISGVFLVGSLGLQRTVVAISIVNFIVAVSFFASFGSRKTALELQPHKKPLDEAPRVFKQVRAVLCLSFLIGFAAIAYEMLYFRVFIYYFSATSYVFPIVLASYLFLMAAGTCAAGYFLNRNIPPGRLIVFAILGILCTSPILFLLPNTLELFGLSLSHLTFRTYYGSRGFASYLLSSTVTSMSCMLPVIFVSMLFPAVIQILAVKRHELGQQVGKVYLIQTYGNFAGALATGYFLIPIFGTVATSKIILATVCVAAMALLLILESNHRAKRACILAGLVLIFAGTVNMFGQSFFQHFTYLDKPPVRVSEDIEGTALIYGPQPEGYYRVNVGAEPSTSYPYRIDSLPLWPLDAALTLLGHEPKRVLIIGLGGGSQAIELHAFYPKAHIVVVELLGVLIDEMKTYGAPQLREMIDDSTVVITDGRRYLNKTRAKGGGNFDYIQIGVYRVTTAGAGNLFTQEFLSSLKDLLAPGGVISFNAYMPAVKAVLDEFDNVIVAARSETAVADVLLSCGKPQTPEGFMQSYLSMRERLKRSIANEPSAPFDIEPPHDAFFLVGQEVLRPILSDISTQTDDLIATEYFATNTTTYQASEDSRYWPRGPHAILIAPLLPDR